MNSYNENLHSSVLSSLESQEMTKKQLSAQLDSSMFTLYYAEGAEIVAQEKLDSTTKMYQDNQHINNVMVVNKNMSDNLLLTANQQKTYTTQSVNNMAVCASNLQIASNSIVRLASDIGSIYSIINAADYGTQIYQQGLEAYNLINKTAYHAEETSQHAMEASASIAEVASATIADGAKLTNTSVNNLLQVTTADLNTITAILTADNATKAQSSMATRSAEGAIKCSKVAYEASKKAYKINNAKFNQNLEVKVPKPFDSSEKGSFTVSFDYYKSPFSVKDRGPETPNLGLEKPVQNYNIIVVKDSKKSFFNVSTAEDLLNNPSQFKRISVLQDSNTSNKVTVSVGLNELLDSDNEPLSLGESYVAFLLIIFSENYKKEINTFDEYLSAPSETFTLTHTLNQAEKIKPPKVSDASTDKNKLHDHKNVPITTINFTVEKEEKIKISEVNYRCLLLPYPDDFLTNAELNSLEYKIETTEVDEEILTVEEEVKFLKEEIENLNSGITQLTAETSKAPKTDAKNTAESDVAKQKNSNFKEALNEAKAKLANAAELLKKLNAEKDKIEKNSPKPVKNDKAFFFNLNLAENVPAGNYTVAQPDKALLGSDNWTFEALIDSTTTDNFGNPLMEQKKYIPVILSFYSGNEISKSKYTNSLSDWENTTPFSYSANEKETIPTN
ncbi:hypothetical protein [Flavobacterium sp. FlaQc-47]|uniref:hypothetical protein n=1 Tax=Flavobacterium sp. FlaQc-47 TaxID=3374180 RepID=UPI0037582819